MISDSKVIGYLNAIENFLAPLPAHQRQQVVEEIARQLEEQIKTSPGPLEAVLDKLEHPRSVADRILKEKGFAPLGDHPRPKFWLWLIGLFTLSMFLSMGTCAWFGWQWTKRNFIDHNISKDWSKLKLENAIKYEKDIDVSSLSIERLVIEFSSGRMLTRTWDEPFIRIRCQVTPEEPQVDVSESANEVRILGDDIMMMCEIRFPHRLSLSIDGDNGWVSALNIRQPTSIFLDNGWVGLGLDKHTKYDFQIRLDVGSADSFESQPDDKAIPVVVDVAHGMVTRVDENVH